VFFGKISYSLYLVHWPLFVFYSYRQIAPLSLGEGAVLLVASVAIATAMYRYIEQPFRGARWRLAPARFVTSCVALAALVVAPAASAWANGGWLWRFPASVAEQLSFKLDQFNGYVWVDQSKMDRDFAHDGKVKVLVAGDSQGGDLINALLAGGASEKLDLSTVMHYGCPPAAPADLDAYLTAVSEYTKLLHVSYDCKARLSEFRAKVLERKPDVVIISAFWFDDKAVPFLPETAAFLRAHGVKKVFVVGFKKQEIDGVKLLATYGLRGNVSAIKLPMPAKTLHINERIGNVASNFTFIDPADLVCDDKGCSQFTDEGYIIFYDGIHLTPQGAKLFGKRFMDRWGRQIFD
jgi:hypothetical protein